MRIDVKEMKQINNVTCTFGAKRMNVYSVKQ